MAIQNAPDKKLTLSQVKLLEKFSKYVKKKFRYINMWQRIFHFIKKVELVGKIQFVIIYHSMTVSER